MHQIRSAKQFKIKRIAKIQRKKKMFKIACLSATVFVASMSYIAVHSRAAELQTSDSKAYVVYCVADNVEQGIQISDKKEESVYDVPLPEELQLHIAELCEEYHIDTKIVMAIIWHESRYQPEVIGDQGRSFGLMQVQKKFHLERMERLNVDDLLDPYQNVTVGIDILAEMIDHYDGNVEKALVAYQYGYTGANQYFFSKGVYCNDFSKSVFEKAGEFGVRS